MQDGNPQAVQIQAGQEARWLTGLELKPVVLTAQLELLELEPVVLTTLLKLELVELMHADGCL